MSKFCASALVLTLSLGSVGFAAEDEIPSTKYVHEDAAGKLEIIGKAAVVLTGSDHFVNRIMEDVIAISLLDKGIKVAYPKEAHLGKPREELKGDPVELARAAGANVLITGTVVTEPPTETQYGRFVRSLRVSFASLSLVDVPMDKTLIWILYEPESGVTATKVARAFVQTLVESLK